MNIYQILETLKRVEEGQMKHHMWDMAERLSLEKFLDMFPDSEDFYLGVHGVDSREELDQDDPTAPAQPGSWTPERIAAAKSKGDWFNETDVDDSESDEGDYQDIPGTHATTKQSAPLPDHVQQQIIRNPAMRADIIAAYKRQQGIDEGGKFKFANPKQRPGDQVRGTEKVVSKKGQHPFKGRLVGTDESKLDEKCWDGYQQQGMKKKGARQVPNCVPVEEEYEAYMNELVGTYGMTSGGTATGGNTNTNTAAGQEINTITKNLQNLKSKVPNLNIQKATAALSKADDSDPLSSQDKDAASALADPVANLIKDPQLGQQLKQLIDKGMQKDQAAAQLAKQQGGA